MPHIFPELLNVKQGQYLWHTSQPILLRPYNRLRSWCAVSRQGAWQTMNVKPDSRLYRCMSFRLSLQAVQHHRNVHTPNGQSMPYCAYGLPLSDVPVWCVLIESSYRSSCMYNIVTYKPPDYQAGQVRITSRRRYNIIQKDRRGLLLLCCRMLLRHPDKHPAEAVRFHVQDIRADRYVNHHIYCHISW